MLQYMTGNGKTSDSRKGFRKYTCFYCSYCTYNKTFLSRHLVKHTGERPYICEPCGKGYSRKYNLQLHMVKCHLTKPHKTT